MLKNIVKYLKENPGPGFNKLTEITTHIFISDYENSNDIELLKSFGIRVILDMSNMERDAEIIKQFSKKRFDYIPFKADLGKLSLEKFIDCINAGYDIIHGAIAQNYKILVHCIDGVNISVVFVIFYLLKRYYLTNFLINIEKTKEIVNPESYFLLNIIKFIKDRRLCIEPEPELIMQLLKVEDVIKDYYTKTLQIAADEYKIQYLKELIEEDKDKNELDPYGDMDEPANIIEFLDRKYGKSPEPEKIEKNYDKLSDLFNL